MKIKRFTIPVFAFLIFLLVLSCGKTADDSVTLERKDLPKIESVAAEEDVQPPEPQVKDQPLEPEKTPEKEPAPTVKQKIEKKDLTGKQEISESKDKPVVKPEPNVFSVKVTSIQNQGNDYYNVVLNNQIEILDVLVRKDDNMVTFPYSTSNDKRYYFIWFDDTELMSSIKKAIIKNDISGTAEPLKITNVEFSPRESKTLKGYGKVQYNDAFWINSFPLFIGGRTDGIGMPSVRGDDGKYIDKIKFTDKDLRDRVENAIMQKYNEQ
ncbi:MAG TPA: hypothetical protein ENN73_07180 [Firmicutes bacterium]|nr:hypothetical protein [Bacillota bacterium]